jgi:c-di-GMP-binding flagellar brake protein YcgR
VVRRLHVDWGMDAAPESARQAGWAREIHERREHKRAEFAAPALLDAARSWHKGLCENISLGGVKVRTDAGLDIGTEVEVYFELPRGVAIETRARVVRTADGELGLAFVGLDGEAAGALRSFCL